MDASEGGGSWEGRPEGGGGETPKVINVRMAEFGAEDAKEDWVLGGTTELHVLVGAEAGAAEQDLPRLARVGAIGWQGQDELSKARSWGLIWGREVEGEGEGEGVVLGEREGRRRGGCGGRHWPPGERVADGVPANSPLNELHPQASRRFIEASFANP